MHKLIFTLCLFWLSQSLMSQDISFYHRSLDDKFDMPKVEWGLNATEFQLLSREVRLMDWLYGAAVPGYVHFKAKDNTMGYSLVAVRSVGYAGLTFVLLDTKGSLSDIFQGEYSGSLSSKTYSRITEASLILIFGSYLFDMIHGNYRLQKKQEMIRYKYSTKLHFSRNSNSLSMRFDPNQTTLFGLTMNF